MSTHPSPARHPERDRDGAPRTGCASARLRRAREAGFSMLELMIASLMSLLVVGGMLLLLNGLEDVHRDTQELIDARQGARLALEQMQRDLQLAGAGLGSMLSPLPVIVPRADGGVDIRHNQGGVRSPMTATQGSGYFVVADASEFEAGMVVAAYDSVGAMDLVTLTGVDTVNQRLSYSGAVSKVYTATDGGAVTRVQTIGYYETAFDGENALVRQVDGGTVHPVALYVTDLTITYYNSSSPPVAFTPVTVADQLNIQSLEIDLTVETENVKLNTTSTRQVTLSIRVTPRPVLLSS